jgi:hypothetical protein
MLNACQRRLYYITVLSFLSSVSTLAYCGLAEALSAQTLPSSSAISQTRTSPRGYRIEVPLGQRRILPDGSRVEADGTVILPNKVRFKVIRDVNGNVTNVQLFSPNGYKLKPGQSITVNGERFEQPCSYTDVNCQQSESDFVK